MKVAVEAMTGKPGHSTPSHPAAPLSVEIITRSELWAGGAFDDALSRAADAAYANAGNDRAREVTLVLSCDEEIRGLNRKWADKDRATDVLSFPAGTEDSALGDIILAYETVARDAAETGVEMPAHASHLVIHGMLHLLGYDHYADASAAEMEALETEILAGLGLHDPYPESQHGLEQ